MKKYLLGSIETNKHFYLYSYLHYLTEEDGERYETHSHLDKIYKKFSKFRCARAILNRNGYSVKYLSLEKEY